MVEYEPIQLVDPFNEMQYSVNSSLGIESWQTGSIHLRNLKERIALPNGARVKYAGLMDRGYWLGRGSSLFGSKLGEVRIEKNRDKQTIDFIIDAYTGSDDHHKFVMGHEEGHVVDKTGNLGVLWQVAKKEGYEFDFFTEEYALASDELTKRLFYVGGTEEEVNLYWNKPLNEKEMLAHVSGLIALVRADVNPNLILQIEQAIRTNSDYIVKEALEKAA